MLRLVLLFAMLSVGGCASAPPQKKAVEMTTIVGTLLEARLEEMRFYRTDAPVHDTFWSEEIEVAIESPKEVAGLRMRFSSVETSPLSYADLKGKRVRLSVPKVWLARPMIDLPSGMHLEEEPNQPPEPTR